MNLPVVLSLGAEAEFDEAVDWYERKAGTGAEFLARIRAVLHVKLDRIEVVAIFHGHRDPAEWRRCV